MHPAGWLLSIIIVRSEDKTMSKPGINLKNSSTRHTLLAASTGMSILVKCLEKRLHLPMGWYNTPTSCEVLHYQLFKDLSVLSIQSTEKISNKTG